MYFLSTDLVVFIRFVTKIPKFGHSFQDMNTSNFLMINDSWIKEPETGAIYQEKLSQIVRFFKSESYITVKYFLWIILKKFKLAINFKELINYKY